MNVQSEIILQSLNGMFRNRHLYPPGHPSQKVMAKKTFDLITAYVNEKDGAFFGIINDTFVFDDFPMLDANKNFSELYKHIENNGIEAVSFKKGFTEIELLDALDVIADETNLSGEDLVRLLKSKGIRLITLKVKESGDQSAMEIFEGAITAIKGVLGEVRMGKIPDSTEIKGIVDKMTDSVLKDPNAMVGLTMIKDYDDYLYTHCVNVGLLSITIGTAMGLDAEQLHNVGLGGMLHDIGKTAVSEDIIKKAGSLDTEEWNQLKAHPVMGTDIASRMEGIDEVVTHMIYEHHVRYDHSGYPAYDDTLHSLTPIATIADAYDAITTLRVYQKPCSPLEAIKILKGLSGKHFEPKTLNAFIKTLGLYPVGTTVKLTTGETAVVTKAIHEEDDTQKAKLIYDKDGKMMTPPVEIELAKEGTDGPAIVEPVDTDYDLSDLFEREAKESLPASE
ncbi:MAG: HD domain-containing phosphohydrolase [Thermodesulfobacteriota bacterium]